MPISQAICYAQLTVLSHFAVALVPPLHWLQSMQLSPLAVVLLFHCPSLAHRPCAPFPFLMTVKYVLLVYITQNLPFKSISSIQLWSLKHIHSLESQPRLPHLRNIFPGGKTSVCHTGSLSPSLGSYHFASYSTTPIALDASRVLVASLYEGIPPRFILTPSSWHHFSG